MDSSTISKLDKARRYAGEPWRAKIQHLEVHFQGDNDAHTISHDGEHWRCTCRHFERMGECAHIMAVKHLIERATNPQSVDHAAHLLSH